LRDLIDSELSSRVLSRAQGLSPKLIDLRRNIHRRPELGFEEFETALRIRGIIEENSSGVKVSEIAKTGVLAIVGDNPTVLLRASIDALPIVEFNDTEYVSLVNGKSHVCGHDAQVAALVGATILLSEQDSPPSIACLFQPAEEIDLGAKAIIESGVLQQLPLRAIIGFHGNPAIDAGYFGVSSGPVMACITTIYCQIEGDGSHGAEPYLGSDPISSLAALISDWQIAINRRIDSRESVVLSVGKVESGTAANVIPSKAILEATLRYLNPDLGKALETVIQDVARSVEVRFGTAIHLKIERMVPALVNDERVTSYVASGITDVTGPKGVLAAIPSLGGDDFSFYLESIPGCYFFVGERQANRPPYGWHDPRYDIDEKSIALAAAVLTMTGIRAGQGVQI